MNELISYVDKYKSHGFICFTSSLGEEIKNNKVVKKLCMPKAWNKCINKENMDKYINLAHNALCIKTGLDSNIIVIDWDFHKSTETLSIYDELIQKYGKPDTFINKSGNGGEHWFFKYEHDRHLHITSHSDTKLHGKKYAVDIKTNGGCILSPPTTYKTMENSIKKYTNIIPIEKMSNVPEWIYTVFDSFKPPIDNTDDTDDIKPSDSVSNFDGSSNINSEAPTTYNYSLELKNDLLILIDCLKQERVDSRDDWLKIGFSLHSVKNVETFSVWNEWSKKSSKYVAGECEKIWESMKNNTDNLCSLGTLKYLAKQDNPSLYSQRFMKTKIFKESMKFFNHYNVANLLYHFFDDNYMYDNIFNYWFELNNNNTWTIYKNTPTSLLKIIQDSLIKKIYTYISQLTNIAASLEYSNNINELIKKCISNINTLGCSSFINGVIQAAKYVFDADFITKKMDQNRYIFAFSDVLYDLQTCCTRPIKPDDYITVTTGYPYPKENPDAEKEVLSFINSIFENTEVEDYVLKIIASSILGYKRYEEFYVWTGKGRNGKGSLTELITTAFGEYYKTIDMSFFTKLKKSSSEATPELADKRTCRILFSTEPEKSEQLMASKLKQITGNDMIHSRALYQNEIISFVPQFSLFLQTNDIPTLSKVDHAVIARMKVIHFPFVFTSNPKEDNERLGDPTLKESKLKSVAWRDTFILLLLKYYKDFIKDAKTISPPKNVLEDTKTYFEDSNPLTEWFNKFCERKKFSTIGSTELYNHFRENSNIELSIHKFAEYMKVLGFEKYRTTKGFIYKDLFIKILIE